MPGTQEVAELEPHDQHGDRLDRPEEGAHSALPEEQTLCANVEQAADVSQIDPVPNIIKVLA